MDTKQLLNDEELTAVAGGNQASMNQWSQSVGFILRQLEDMAANASAADQAVLRRYISALKSTCSEAGTESASITIANIYDECSICKCLRTRAVQNTSAGAPSAASAISTGK